MAAMPPVSVRFDPSNPKGQHRLFVLAVYRMLRTEVEMPPEEPDVEDWLVENVGPRCRVHPLHAAIEPTRPNPGMWDEGMWGDHRFFWFKRKVDAARFVLLFGGRPTASDPERRRLLLNWAKFQ